jgi:hypothetical protein
VTYTQAIAKADRLAKARGREYFVVDSYEEYNGSRYQVADTYDLDGFFCGAPVLYSTVEGWDND